MCLVVLASSHEAHHAALNASTSWGAMLQAVALPQGLPSTPKYGVVLRYLVAVAARTHEAHATHASVMDVLRAGVQLARQSCLARTLRIVATWTQQWQSTARSCRRVHQRVAADSHGVRVAGMHAVDRTMFFCRRASTGSRHPCFLAGITPTAACRCSIAATLSGGTRVPPGPARRRQRSGTQYPLASSHVASIFFGETGPG